MFSLNSFFISPRNGVLRRDLYYLVKFLPAYQLPAGMPSAADLLQSEAELNSTTSPESISEYDNGPSSEGPRPSFSTQASGLHHRNTPSSPAILPQHVNDVSPKTPKGLTINPGEGKQVTFSNLMSPRYVPSRRSVYEKERFILNKNEEESDLLPAYMPPKYSYLDLFPFSLLVKFLTEKGKDLRGKKAAKWRARLRGQAVSHNLPLEISLYIVSKDLLVFSPSVADPYSSEFLCCNTST
jgi:putative membrane protein